MSKQYIFATHMGTGNRGCEALTKSLCTLLDLDKKQVTICSQYYEEDIQSDLQDYGLIVPTNLWSKLSIIKKIWYKLLALITNNPKIVMRKKYDLSCVTKEAVVFITGGDLYCYDGTIRLMRYIHDYCLEQGATVMLIGCSIDEKYLNEEVIKDLEKYRLITVRESVTLENLRKAGITDNVFLIPDSAFSLLPQSTGIQMPNAKGIIGINISIYVNNGEKEETLFMKNVENLIKYILEKTDDEIVLIPHVFWKEQNDRLMLKMVKDKFSTSRIQILNTEDMNYCQIRYVISKCRFFVGARTHSVISAYSAGIPAIALGYSVKSIGIAKDLGLNEKTIIDCNCLTREDELVEAYIYSIENEKEIKCRLDYIMSDYRKKAAEIKNIVKEYEKY